MCICRKRSAVLRCSDLSVFLSWHRAVVTDLGATGVALTEVVFDHWVIGRARTSKLLSCHYLTDVDQKKRRAENNEKNADNNEKLHGVKL